MHKDINLTRRGEVYYFRARLPGGREFKRSLKTRQIREARRRAKTLRATLYGLKAVSDLDKIFKELADAGIDIDPNNLPLRKINRLEIGDVQIHGLEVDPSKPGDAEAAAMAIRAAVESHPADTPTQKPNKRSPLLREAIEAYITDKQVHGDSWTPRTAEEIRGNLELLMQLIGADIACADIDYEVTRTIKEKLFKLPPNIAKSSRYMGLTIDQIIALGDKPRSVSTANKLLVRYSSLFDWMTRHGYVDRNYFAALTVRQRNSKKDDRRPYTDAELRIFFGELQSRPRANEGWRKWLPLLLLYTGARLEELCQLWCSDIQQLNDRWVISIKSSDDRFDPKQIKTPSAKRLIPLHSELLKAGFLEFVFAQAESRNVRIFHDLKRQSNRYGHYPSRWFSSVRASLGWVGMSPKLDMHSFRHNVATCLQEQGVPEYQIAAILGHSYGESQTGQTYAKRPGTDITGPAIEMLKYNIP